MLHIVIESCWISYYNKAYLQMGETVNTMIWPYFCQGSGIDQKLRLIFLLQLKLVSQIYSVLNQND